MHKRDTINLFCPEVERGPPLLRKRREVGMMGVMGENEKKTLRG